MVLRRSRAPRTGTPADLLVVGLGNPGDEYARTRHNVGAEVVELLATRHGAKLKKGKERARVDEVRIGGKRVALAIPLTYMNDSGEAVGLLARRYGVEPDQVVIVHDELDLPVATLKVKSGGGLAGPQRPAVDQVPPAQRRVPARAHRRRQAGEQGARRGPRAQPVRQARAGRDRRHDRAGRRRGRDDRDRRRRRGHEPFNYATDSVTHRFGVLRTRRGTSSHRNGMRGLRSVGERASR